MSKKNELDPYVISHTETFNRYLLTISSAAFPAIWYLIKDGKGFLLGFKISLGLFALAIIMTMFALILVIDDPEPQKCKWFFLYCIDWVSFILFCTAIVVTYLSLICD